MVESKDGTAVAIDLFRPQGSGDERLPTILWLSPYHGTNGPNWYPKDRPQIDGTPPPPWTWLLNHFVPRGYALALADMRGTRNSSGCFDFGGIGDQQDGYALVEWLASQPWSNGKVGMFGVSHVGMSQLATAVANPPHLTTIVPIAAIASFYRYLYASGVHYDVNMATPATYNAYAAAPPVDPTSPSFIRTVSETGCNPEYNLKGMSQDGRLDSFWLERDYPSHASQINASVFLVHGFLDHNVRFDHADAIWRALSQRPDPPTLKAYFGQWAHQQPPSPESFRPMVHRWMDHWLLGIDTGVMQEPSVSIQSSEQAWRHVSSWPPEGGDEHTLHLAAGRLVETPPEPGAESFQDVPGAMRNRDPPGSVLRFESAPLSQTLHVSGTPSFVLQASSDKTSTHWVVLAYDVGPDGRAVLWNRGYLDSKQRNGLHLDDPLVPGQRTSFNISLYPADYVVEAGHLLRLIVKSSDDCGCLFEAITDRCMDNPQEPCNPVTGVVSDVTAARNTVYYGGDPSTSFVMPIAPG